MRTSLSSVHASIESYCAKPGGQLNFEQIMKRKTRKALKFISCRKGLSSTKHQNRWERWHGKNGARSDHTSQVRKTAANGQQPPLSPFAPQDPSYANLSSEKCSEDGDNNRLELELGVDGVLIQYKLGSVSRTLGIWRKMLHRTRCSGQLLCVRFNHITTCDEQK